MPKCDFNRQTYFPGHLVGKLEVHDGDSGDSVSLHLRGPYARIFKGNLLWGIDNKTVRIKEISVTHSL